MTAAAVVGLCLFLAPIVGAVLAWRSGTKLPTRVASTEPLTARQEAIPGQWEQPPSRWQQPPRMALGGGITAAEASESLRVRFSPGGLIR